MYVKRLPDIDSWAFRRGVSRKNFFPMLESKGEFTWKIPKFALTGKEYISEPFEIGNGEWKLSIKIGIANKGYYFMDIYLYAIKSKAEPATWSRTNVTYSVHIRNSGGNGNVTSVSKTNATFGNMEGLSNRMLEATSIRFPSLSEALDKDGSLTVVTEIAQTVSNAAGKLYANLTHLRAEKRAGANKSKFYRASNFADVEFVVAQTEEDPAVESSAEPAEGSADESRSITPDSHSSEETATNAPKETKEHKFPAHRVILAAETEYFTKMFTSELSEGSSKGMASVKVEGFTHQEIESMLEFIYTGTISRELSSFDDWLRMIELADRYQLENLYCYSGAQLMEKHINLENCFVILDASCTYSSISGLFKNACLEFVKFHFELLKKSNQFKVFTTTTKNGILFFELVSDE